MFRRFCLVFGSAALAISVLAGPSFATGSTPHAKLTCDPAAKNKGQAPAVGSQATFQAGPAGSLVVKRADASTLSFVSANPTAGWTQQVASASGKRVRVAFRNAGTGELEHFGLSLSAKGTFVMSSTSHCHH
jgi:hypothetical protein